MANCVMCDKSVTGYYDFEGEKIPICFEHYEDGTFANYLAAQQSMHLTGGESVENQALPTPEVLSAPKQNLVPPTRK